ncbi:hypothetical protein MCEMSE6_02238 [Oxalobacteraceae bacterium]
MNKFRSLKEKMKKASVIKQVFKTNMLQQQHTNYLSGEHLVSFRGNMKGLSDHIEEVMKSNPPQQRTPKDMASEQSISLREKLQQSSERSIAATKAELFEDEFEATENHQQQPIGARKRP